MADTDPILVTMQKADDAFASFLNLTGSKTRLALDAIIPKGGTVASTSVAQFVTQKADGTWPNPVRDSNTAGRVYVAAVAASKTPVQTDGLRVGDVLIGETGVYIASYVPSVGAPSWKAASSPAGSTTTTTTTPGTGTTGGTTTTPGTGTTTTTTTTTTPSTSGDTSTPSPTSRPFALLGTTGTWATTGGATLIQSLSDQQVTSASATPAAPGGGVSITIDMSNFAHTAGNDLTLTLWGATSAEPGDVTATIGNGTTQFASPKTLQVSATSTNLAFVWPATDQMTLTADQWRDVQVTVTRTTGGFTNLADLTLQSTPPKVPTGPVVVNDPASLTWASGAVWTSQLQTAPLARASADIVTYVRNQAGTAMRLDCLPGGDDASIWMVNSTTPRVNITPPASSSRGSVTLMSAADGSGALQSVPIPPTMPAPSNLFKTVCFASLETRQVWEIIGLTKTATGWSAEWGGRIDNTTSNGGVFPTSTGYTGSGLSFTAAAIKVSEAKNALNGQVAAIQHAIGLNLNYGTTSSQFCWPATRSDGTSTALGAPAMGQRLRLKSTFNVDTATGLTPIGKAVAKAMQTYGVVIMGGAARPSILCESGVVEQQTTGVDPWGAVLAGKTIDTVLAGIPLDQLEAISPGWGGPNWVAEPTVTVTPTPTPTPTPTTGNAASRILGPTRSGLPWHSGCKADGSYSTAMVEKFGTWRGRPVDGGITYPEYGQVGTNADGTPKWATRNDLIGSGWCATLYNGFPGRILYGMAPFSHAEFYGEKNADGRLWARLANGEMDDIIDGQANFLVNNGRGNSIIRIAWEWNGDWYSWYSGYAGVTNFKNGFRRIVQRFRAKSNNFKFCFEVNGFTKLYGDPGNNILSLAYPGDDVVDLIGTDQYNFRSDGGTDGAFSHYLRSPSKGVGLDDVADFARAHGKGMAIMEWGIHGTDGYGDNPGFIQGMWDWLVANQDVVAVESYFNEAGDYIKCSLYNSTNGAIQNPLSAAKYKELWGRGV